MNKNIIIAIIAVVVILLAGGAYISSQSGQEANSRQTQAPEKPEGNVDNSEKTQATDDSGLWAGMGSYEDYSVERVQSELEAGRKVVLFFHAPWCPYCKAANIAFTDNESKIPQGVTVFKTDYDSNTELKQKYGVTYQHTFVQIDSEGKMITKWNGGDIDNLIKNLK